MLNSQEKKVLISLSSQVGDLSSATLSKVSDAPADGKNYARKDGAWVEVVAGEGGGGLTHAQILAKVLL